MSAQGRGLNGSETGSYRARSSRALIALARVGDTRAMSVLFSRQQASLRQWARGRLPQWARGVVDTGDLVQEALLKTFRRIHVFDDRGRGALQAYLRESVTNRIRDELRRVARQPMRDTLDDRLHDHGASPFDVAVDAELARRYKFALQTLSENERLLVVGRIEMSYTYEQLALATHRATPAAARLAARRAVLKLAQKMAE